MCRQTRGLSPTTQGGNVSWFPDKTNQNTTLHGESFIRSPGLETCKINRGGYRISDGQRLHNYYIFSTQTCIYLCMWMFIIEHILRPKPLFKIQYLSLQCKARTKDQYMFSREELGLERYILHIIFQRGISCQSVLIQYKTSMKSVYMSQIWK